VALFACWPADFGHLFLELGQVFLCLLLELLQLFAGTKKVPPSLRLHKRASLLLVDKTKEARMESAVCLSGKEKKENELLPSPFFGSIFSQSIPSDSHH